MIWNKETVVEKDNDLFSKESGKNLNLKAAVEREKAVQAIDVHRECKNCVVTFWVMSQLFHFLGALRGCADFRDPTAVFRLKGTRS
jgi:hypothetical protein